MYLFNEVERGIREAVKELLNHYMISTNNDLLGKLQADKLMREFCEYGYGALMISSEFGGCNLNALSSMIVINEIAKEDAGLAHVVATHNFGFLYPIYLMGTEDQKERYLKETTHGKRFGTLAFNEATETIVTTASKQNDYYILNGAKSMITEINHADYALVFARTDKNSKGYTGCSIFIVDLNNTPGIECGNPEKLMGFESLQICDITFTNVKIHKSDMLFHENEGGICIMKSMELMRITNAAIALGVSQSAYDEALEYSKNRKVEGNLLCDMQYIQYKLADMKTILENDEILTYYTANIYDKKVDNTVFYSTLCKLQVTERAKKICDEALQIFGGYGYVKGYKVERLYRDIRILTIIGGTSESLRALVARNII